MDGPLCEAASSKSTAKRLALLDLAVPSDVCSTSHTHPGQAVGLNPFNVIQ
jgi:hypothetical protein